MKSRLGSRPLLLSFVAVLVAGACGGGGQPAATPTPAPATSAPQQNESSVAATEKDFSIALDASSTSAGKVDFIVTNDGPSVHEFVVFKTDLAPDKLPLKSGAVDESGAGVTHIDEIEGINPNTTQKLEVDLQAGKYVLICNLPGHYQSGMHVGLTVS
jgi:uncharacterized cupredoxin-like copper-binding protein